MKKTPSPAEIRQPAAKAGNTHIAHSEKASHQFNPSQYPCWMFPTNHPPRWWSQRPEKEEEPIPQTTKKANPCPQ